MYDAKYDEITNLIDPLIQLLVSSSSKKINNENFQEKIEKK
jgi:hypothetical protein